MTEQEKNNLRARLKKAADNAYDEWRFYESVVALAQKDADQAYQRFIFLLDATRDIKNFNFNEEE